MPNLLQLCYINVNSDLAELHHYLLSYHSISASYAIVFLFTPEIFPTNIRNTTVGIVDAVARLGRMEHCLVVDIDGQLLFFMIQSNVLTDDFT